MVPFQWPRGSVFIEERKDRCLQPCGCARGSSWGPVCGAGWGGRRGPSLAAVQRGRRADTEQDGRSSSADYTQGPPWVPVEQTLQAERRGQHPGRSCVGRKAGRPEESPQLGMCAVSQE